MLLLEYTQQKCYTFTYSVQYLIYVHYNMLNLEKSSIKAALSHTYRLVEHQTQYKRIKVEMCETTTVQNNCSLTKIT